MDLNQLLYHHQIALMEYSSGASRKAVHNETFHNEAGQSHFDMVAHYARRIMRLRKQMGVSVYPEWV